MTRRYVPVVVRGGPPKPPASLSAKRQAMHGPITAINGAITDTITDSSLDKPMEFMWSGRKGRRLPIAKKFNKKTNGIFSFFKNRVITSEEQEENTF